MKISSTLLWLLCLPLSGCVLYRADKVQVDHPLQILPDNVQSRERNLARALRGEMQGK